MIAAFAMPDRAGTAPVHGRLWSRVRARLTDAPDHLSRACDDELWGLWENPELLSGVSCGLPLRGRLKDRVQLVDSQANGLPGRQRGYHLSRSVVSAAAAPRPVRDDARARFAFHQPFSQSGWAEARHHPATT